MINWIKALRPLNLIIIMITIMMVKKGIINQECIGNVPSQLTYFEFFLLLLSVLSIAGAGNLINDFYDVEADLINKPQKLFVSRHLDKRKVLIVYFIITGVGLLTGALLSVLAGRWYLAGIFPSVAVILWLYSAKWKGMPMIGNIIIALLTSITILTVLWFDMPGDIILEWNNIWKVSFFIMIFAFLLNWVREIVKDLQDMLGDEVSGYNTMPIIYGVKKSKQLAIMILSTTTVLISWVYFESGFLFIPQAKFLYWAIILFMLVSSILLYFFLKPKQYNVVSQLIKITMLLGIIAIFFITC